MVFIWTKAHVGTFGNEKEADKLAKEGTTLDEITPALVLTCSANNLVDQGVWSLSTAKTTNALDDNSQLGVDTQDDDIFIFPYFFPFEQILNVIY